MVEQRAPLPPPFVVRLGLRTRRPAWLPLRPTYQRRLQDWQYQLSLATVESQQVAKQILASTVRQAIANQEVANQQLQTDNAQTEDDFMHSKFTNTDLYAYMIGQLSTTYFQSYQLAYAMAKQTEQTFRYELGLRIPAISILATGTVSRRAACRRAAHVRRTQHGEGLS